MNIAQILTRSLIYDISYCDLIFFLVTITNYFSIHNIKKKFSCQQTRNISPNIAFFFKMVTSHRYMLISEKLGFYLLWFSKVPAICHSSGKSAVKIPKTMCQEFVLSCSLSLSLRSLT